MKPLVYVAAPYTRPDPCENVHRIVKLGTRLVEEGVVTPILPHLTMLWHTIDPHPVDFWYAYDLEVMRRCDAVLRLSGESTGADAEVKEALEIELPVSHSISSLYLWVVDR